MAIKTYPHQRRDTLLWRAAQKVGHSIGFAMRNIRRNARAMRDAVMGETPFDVSQSHSSQEDEESNHVDSSEEVSLESGSGEVADKKIKFITDRIMEIVDENGPLLNKTTDRKNCLRRMRDVRKDLNDAVIQLAKIDGLKDRADYLVTVLPISQPGTATVDSFRSALADFGREALAVQMTTSVFDTGMCEAYSAAGHFTNAPGA